MHVFTYALGETMYIRGKNFLQTETTAVAKEMYVRIQFRIPAGLWAVCFAREPRVVETGVALNATNDV